MLPRTVEGMWLTKALIKALTYYELLPEAEIKRGHRQRV